MLCQNTCDVPFGITAIDNRPGVLPPEHAAVKTAAATAARNQERDIIPPSPHKWD